MRTLAVDALILLVQSVHADTPPEVKTFLSEWAAKMRKARTLRVRFEQTKTLRVLRKPRKSRGVARLKEKRLHMIVSDLMGAVEFELLVDGKQVKLHYPVSKRLEIYPHDSSRKSSTPFPLFGGDVKALPAHYRITHSTDRGQDLLVMLPRDKRASIAVVKMWFTDHLVTALEQRSHRGDHVRLEITEFKLNPDLSKIALTLKVPPGTRVSRQIGK